VPGRRTILILSLVAITAALTGVALLSYYSNRPQADYPNLSASRYLDLDGGDVALNYLAHNDADVAVSYTYYLYQDDELWSSDTVLVPAATSYSVGTRVPAQGEGIGRLRLVVYREGEASPVADITRFMNDKVQ